MSGKQKKITDYTPDERNINQGSEYGDYLLEKSLREVGLGRSILADKNGVIIAGNKTLEKAGAIGLTDVFEVESDGQTLIVVKRTDLDINTEMGKKAKILDNTTSEHNYVEDAEMAAAIFERVDLSPAEYGLEKIRVPIIQDTFTPGPGTTELKDGDLIEIGIHRILCGDPCTPANFKKLTGDARPLLALCEMKNGELSAQVYRQFSGNTVYLWFENIRSSEAAEALTLAGFEISTEIIWVRKEPGDPGHYQPQHECCYYAIKKGLNHNWQGSRKENTVWEDIEETATGDKPVAIFARAIENNTMPGQGVYAPFCATGTALIAAEQLARPAFLMDPDPIICQGALDRLRAFRPGIQVKLNGEPIGATGGRPKRTRGKRPIEQVIKAPPRKKNKTAKQVEEK